MELMIKIVENYIYTMKGVNVTINIPVTSHQVMLLNTAYQIAINYENSK